jgi:hypothetical protein
MPDRRFGRRRPERRVAAALVLAAAIAATAALPAGALATRRTLASTASSSAAASPASKGGAAPCATIASAQSRLEQQLAQRTSTLTTLRAEVSTSSTLSGADRSTLLTDLADESSGIGALSAKAPTDTTCAQVAADAKTMVLTYRVWAVMAPQTDLVVDADRESAMATTLLGDEPGVAATIATAAARGKDVSAAQAADADLLNQVEAATVALPGLSVSLLSQTPAGFPGNLTVFKGALATETGVRGHLGAGDTDLHQISSLVG